jgi:hypothetical protein
MLKPKNLLLNTTEAKDLSVGRLPKAIGTIDAASFGHPPMHRRPNREEAAMSNAGSRIVRALAFSLWLGLFCGTPAVSAPSWVEEGPGPILNGQELVPDNSPVAGAINAIAASRNNPDLVYVGTVNGGVWRTRNATANPPTWSPLTDRRLPGLSINSLAISPVDSRTLFAGTGSTSSFLFDGSPGFGVARSTDGGRSLDGACTGHL